MRLCFQKSSPIALICWFHVQLSNHENAFCTYKTWSSPIVAHFRVLLNASIIMDNRTAIEKRLDSDLCPVCEKRERMPKPRLLCVACCQESHTGIYDPNRPVVDCEGSCDQVFREMLIKHVYFNKTLEGFDPSTFLHPCPPKRHFIF